MWTEGTLGIVSNMLPTGELENMVEGVISPRNNTALFQSWWEQYGYNSQGNSLMQESDVIKNYGKRYAMFGIYIYITRFIV
jgi:hypothetical protein